MIPGRMAQIQYDSNGIPIGLLEDDPSVQAATAAQQQTQSSNANFESWAASQLDPSSPDYIGPGYADLGRTDSTGRRVLTLVDPQANQAWKMVQQAPVPTNPNPSTTDLVAQAAQAAGIGGGTNRGGGSSAGNTPPVNVSSGASRQAFGAAPTLGRQTQTVTGTPRLPNALTSGFAPIGTGDADPYTAPGAEAPKVDRAAVNAALAPVNTIAGMLTAEALQDRGASLAEAQLREATARAQSSVLGQARAGNRRDRALLERQAIGEGAYLEQEASRQAATLRAQEELQDRQFKVDTLTKAGELGLNVAAYEVDLAKADLGSATNWINQEFQQRGIDKQLSQQEMANILQFTRDMAAIQFQYDQLSVEDQNEADRLLMQKYGIDKQTKIALKQIKEQGRFRWDNLLAGMASGFGAGAAGLLGKAF